MATVQISVFNGIFAKSMYCQKTSHYIHDSAVEKLVKLVKASGYHVLFSTARNVYEEISKAMYYKNNRKINITLCNFLFF